MYHNCWKHPVNSIQVYRIFLEIKENDRLFFARSMSKRSGWKQTCSKCGLPRRGHRCRYDDTQKYQATQVLTSDSDDDVIALDFDGPYKNKYLMNYADAKSATGFLTLFAAQQYCAKIRAGGITKEGRMYTIRQYAVLKNSTKQEISWVNNDAPSKAYLSPSTKSRKTASMSLSPPVLASAPASLSAPASSPAYPPASLSAPAPAPASSSAPVIASISAPTSTPALVLPPLKAIPTVVTQSASISSTTLAADDSADSLFEWEDGHTFDITTQVEIPTNIWKEYDDAIQMQLNRAMHRGDKRIKISIHGTNYTITLTAGSMRQTKVDNGFVRRVRSKPAPVVPTSGTTSHSKQFHDFKTSQSHFGTGSFPSLQSTPISRVVDMTNDAMPSSYRDIAGQFSRTLFKGNGTAISTTDFTLTSIEHIYNEDKWEAYNFKKKQMTKQLGDSNSVNEMWLYHGTGPSSVSSLLLNGFERNFGKFMAYGDGVYFSRYASYSFLDQYAKIEKDSEGRDMKTVLISRVLTGQTCQGASNKKTPDTKADGTFYNSMTDNASSPSMYILSAGSDNQSYIEFVLRFVRS